MIDIILEGALNEVALGDCPAIGFLRVKAGGSFYNFSRVLDLSP